MKTKIILISLLPSAGLVTSALAAQSRGNGGARQGNCDGSGKSTAPGKGAKDGSGNRTNCPAPPAK